MIARETQLQLSIPCRGTRSPDMPLGVPCTLVSAALEMPFGFEMVDAVSPVREGFQEKAIKPEKDGVWFKDFINSESMYTDYSSSRKEGYRSLLRSSLLESNLEISRAYIKPHTSTDETKRFFERPWSSFPHAPPRPRCRLQTYLTVSKSCPFYSVCTMPSWRSSNGLRTL